jgi:hypothetical protein
MINTPSSVWKITIHLDKKIYACLNYCGTTQGAMKRVIKSFTNDKYAKGEKRDTNKAKEIEINIRYIGERLEHF